MTRGMCAAADLTKFVAAFPIGGGWQSGLMYLPPARSARGGVQTH